VREETFVTETEAAATNYMDTVSGKPLKKMKEQSYFFKQSRYQQQLVAHIEQHPEFIQPARRRNEILARLREDPLRDLSVSRTTFDWGIQVPDAPGHVLYVWFDALTNYLTGAGWPDAPDGGGFLPADVHIIGKDIIWFHCVIWPCMLWSSGMPLPKTVFGHGFVTAQDGQKMSKSIGNVVDPLEQLAKYSSDSFRYLNPEP
jgi:methionyl-tRNA synthetase